MSSVRKDRLTVTVDPDLVEAGNRAVTAGQAASLSGWVNQAMAGQAERDRKLAALANVLAGFESEHGQITAAEIEKQRRLDRTRSRVVQGGVVGSSPRQ